MSTTAWYVDTTFFKHLKEKAKVSQGFGSRYEHQSKGDTQCEEQGDNVNSEECILCQTIWRTYTRKRTYLTFDIQWILVLTKSEVTHKFCLI